MEAKLNITPNLDDVANDDDWIELEPAPKAGTKMPDVTVRITPPAIGADKDGKRRRSPHARAWVVFREDAAVWIENHTRFRVAIGGPYANKIKVTPDKERGRYESGILKGVSRMFLGVINAWPSEGRDSTEARWEIVGDSMVLTLPNDWAKARVPRLAPTPTAPAPPAKPTPLPITTSAPGLIGRSKG
jgi:hypothetical protein